MAARLLCMAAHARILHRTAQPAVNHYCFASWASGVRRMLQATAQLCAHDRSVCLLYPSGECWHARARGRARRHTCTLMHSLLAHGQVGQAGRPADRQTNRQTAQAHARIKSTVHTQEVNQAEKMCRGAPAMEPPSRARYIRRPMPPPTRLRCAGRTRRPSITSSPSKGSLSTRCAMLMSARIASMICTQPRPSRATHGLKPTCADQYKQRPAAAEGTIWSPGAGARWSMQHAIPCSDV